VAVADRNGRQLGFAALAALEATPRPNVRFEYSGPVVSGATLGTWSYRPLAEAIAREKSQWRRRQVTIELAYRPELPSREETESELARWQAEERAALERNDPVRARDCHAQAERMARQLSRLRGLPPGKQLDVPVTIYQLGDAIWV